MRLLNVEILICDRCGDRFEMRLDDAERHAGYGTVTIRSINASPLYLDRKCLSNREQAVLNGITQGKSNKAIARELLMTESTCKVHVKAILRKVGVRNRTQAALACNGHTTSKGQAPMEAITSHVERSSELCRKCMTALEEFMRNGKAQSIVDLLREPVPLLVSAK